MPGDLVPFKDIKDQSKPPKPPKPLSAYEHTATTGNRVADVLLLIIGGLIIFGVFSVIALVMK